MNRLACFAVACVLSVGCSRKGGKTTFASVGTGSVTGVYYQVGQAIMKVMNERTGETGIKVDGRGHRWLGGEYQPHPERRHDGRRLPVGSSVPGLQRGGGMGEQGSAEGVCRAICSFHSEAITFVATEASGIRGLADVKGKTVNIGNPGSGQRQNAIDIFTSVGIDCDKDFTAEGLKASEAPKVMQDGQIDGFFYTVGHPAGAIMEATSGRRPVRFVPITGMDDFIAKYPYYSATTIPIKLYPKAGNKEDVPTIGMLATLVTSEAVDEETIYQLTKGIFENLDGIRELHDAFRGLDAKAMATKGITIPRHPGAERYFREAKLLEE